MLVTKHRSHLISSEGARSGAARCVTSMDLPANSVRCVTPYHASYGKYMSLCYASALVIGVALVLAAIRIFKDDLPYRKP